MSAIPPFDYMNRFYNYMDNVFQKKNNNDNNNLINNNNNNKIFFTEDGTNVISGDIMNNNKNLTISIHSVFNK